MTLQLVRIWGRDMMLGRLASRCNLSANLRRCGAFNKGCQVTLAAQQTKFESHQVRRFAARGRREEDDQNKWFLGWEDSATAWLVGFASIGGLCGVGWYWGWFKLGSGTREDQLVSYLRNQNVMVVVFDVDHVMSTESSGDGLVIHEVEDYLRSTSQDFVHIAKVLSSSGFRLGVATRADPELYMKAGRSKSTHLIGVDIARTLLARRCPEVSKRFEAMVGYDPKLHGNQKHEAGKRYHMRYLQNYFNVPFQQMMLITAIKNDLANEDGWTAILVQDKKQGLQFDDFPVKYV
eukprot:gnl/MRDRNA2_/MRDRNA2_32653_c0_seq1.p1 gnl/MRDRNA2_/MRDRNA2_32653_c0~~gnl/MRDRNA2_/MRDRNA2_32653_c0_seq1.p1  ORF type:complete len:292 (+),score=31.99 gnl/MRDRNA2_/MRDRNA2_32653_c0_seq1:50-925(+)